MALQATDTSQQILSIARAILAADGLGAVSFDAIARRLGRSKQAVLYWYPTKRDLLAAMFLPWLEAEARTAEEAVANVVAKPEAIAAFVRAIARFHLDDLDRFRMMYLAPQTTGMRSTGRGASVTGEEVYQVTGRLYGALARQLCGNDHSNGDAARKQAVAIHSAVLGLVLMFALSDALRDPLKHDAADLVEALIDSLTHNA
ncbi:TetR/AcrR family transcriptional regulator [Roseibium sp.]|uniref:TetR/AcrR family transcriptional regulator n=1 Tax=Roseibium sp. TaxID=1936156 RepID=UPI003A976E62